MVKKEPILSGPGPDVVGIQHKGLSTGQFFLRVRLFEQLLRDLSEIIDESDGGVFFQRVVNAKIY